MLHDGVSKWQTLLEKYAQDAFQRKDHAYTSEAKIAEMKRLISQQTVEICFLPHGSRKSLGHSRPAASSGKSMSQAIQRASAQNGFLTNLC